MYIVPQCDCTITNTACLWITGHSSVNIDTIYLGETQTYICIPYTAVVKQPGRGGEELGNICPEFDKFASGSFSLEGMTINKLRISVTR